MSLARHHSTFGNLGAFLQHATHPHVTVTRAPHWAQRDRDLEAPVRDGTILRLDLYRDARDRKPRPVIMSAHPYGKDHLPRRVGPLWAVSPQYRIFRIPEPIEFSEYTGWESPDPVFWLEHGYCVVTCDLRGAGSSEGRWNPLTVEEGQDVADVIEWVAAQPWCDGNVGLLGVSYLAISQYQAAAQQPEHLKAICPWEGFSDLYRDFARPGGVQEDGFLTMWSHMTQHETTTDVDLLALVSEHELDDDAYASRRPDLQRITVPMLVCGSFSDHNLHSRGSFEAFRGVASPARWLWTHRGGKWSTFYCDEAKADQLAFFDHHLKGADNGWDRRPAVRLATETSRGTVVEHIDEFPPIDTTLLSLLLDSSLTLHEEVPGETREASTVDWSPIDGDLAFRWTVPAAGRVTGPAELVLFAATAHGDFDLFVGLSHYRDGQRIGYEGSFGFEDDFITHGIARASQRAVDEQRSLPGNPVLAHARELDVPLDEAIRLRVPLLPSSTRLEAGDELELRLSPRWFWPHNPVTGQFPATYNALPPAEEITLHLGGADPSRLLLPVR